MESLDVLGEVDLGGLRLDAPNLAALLFFLVCWLGYDVILGAVARLRGGAINRDMTAVRTAWMRNMARRADQITDNQILGHALSSASFFASSNLLLIAAITGALFGGERTFRTAATLPVIQASTRILFEAKLALVLLTLARGLLELIWSIRQMNYCLAVFGAAPPGQDAEARRRFGDIAARLLNPALSAFNRGVRAYHFALPAAAWLFGPWAFLAATGGAVILLVWRQTGSRAAAAIADLRKLLEEPQGP